ncbi:alpha/beta fold hydrolase [Acidovorax sp. A1169]|uniref:alpha/beta fold hydrolase n=1 Tax=Acidovorax sp. A1169 TaxID=3059524 RepID=UPI0027377E9B|nr:alpha/beta fold hydrolase [Acidovorax sp. A1169]MDP4078345.1 alpha/beta fold hydrolase [Acidovorax sp. A1169]
MLTVEHFQLPFRDVQLRGTTTHSPSHSAPRTVALHGGGASSRLGYQPLLDFLADRGHSSVAFDFAGQGESAGDLAASGLRDRAQQALAVVDFLKMPQAVSLIASSMGGHIACSLIEALAPPALVLYCPAAYEAAALEVPFGPAFQQVIRATSDFAASPAFDALERFEGRLLLVLGAEDAVIPRQVEDQYIRRARKARSVEVLRLDGAGHHLHAWLRERPQEAARVAQRVLATLGGAG